MYLSGYHNVLSDGFFAQRVGDDDQLSDDGGDDDFVRFSGLSEVIREIFHRVGIDDVTAPRRHRCAKS